MLNRHWIMEHHLGHYGRNQFTGILATSVLYRGIQSVTKTHKLSNY